LSCNSGDQRTFRNLCQPSRLSIASLLQNLNSSDQLASSTESEAALKTRNGYYPLAKKLAQNELSDFSLLWYLVCGKMHGGLKM
jgi:hypothetical protein